MTRTRAARNIALGLSVGLPALILLLVLLGCRDISGRMDPRLERRVDAELGRVPTRSLHQSAATQPVTVESALATMRERRTASQPVAAVQLSIADLRARVLADNLDLKVIQIDPRIARTSVTEELAKFDAILLANFRRENEDLPPLDDELTQFTRPEQRNRFFGYEPGISVPLPTGGRIQLTAPFDKKALDDPIKFGQYTSALRFSFSQPLLRNGGIDPTVASIRLARYAEASISTRTQLSAIRLLAVAERSYWRLWQAWKELEIRNTQYNLAYENLELVRRRVQEGLSAAIETIRAELGVTERLESVILAETALRLAQRSLKAQTNMDGGDLGSETAINPVSPPALLGLVLDPPTLISQAMATRLELLDLELQLAADAVRIDFARNQTLPLFVLDYGLSVMGRDKAWHEAFEQVGEFDKQGWSVRVRGEIPVTNEAARSRLRRAVETRLQRLATREQRELAIRQEVYDACDVLRQNWQRILAARQNVLVAGVNYDAELTQFKEGLRTMTEVLEGLTRLADAQLREVRAIADYQLSQIDLAFATGTLLGYSNVELAPIPLGFPVSADHSDEPLKLDD